MGELNTFETTSGYIKYVIEPYYDTHEHHDVNIIFPMSYVIYTRRLFQSKNVRWKMTFFGFSLRGRSYEYYVSSFVSVV